MATLYTHAPRNLTPAEDAAITAQRITTRYPDDLTPHAAVTSDSMGLTTATKGHCDG